MKHDKVENGNITNCLCFVFEYTPLFCLTNFVLSCGKVLFFSSFLFCYVGRKRREGRRR